MLRLQAICPAICAAFRLAIHPKIRQASLTGEEIKGCCIFKTEIRSCEVHESLPTFS